MSPLFTIRKFQYRGSCRFLLVALFALVIFPGAAYRVVAQTTSPTDGSTPLGLSPGAPAGSYPLTGFENVNLFNGNLNFHLLLDAIQGRGSAQAASMLAIDAKSWRIKLQRVVNPITGDLDDVFTPLPSLWNGHVPGLGPGILVGRQSGGRDIIYCSYRSNPARYITLTRLTFTVSDGTEYELRDQQTNGQPLAIPSPCSFVAPTRGTVFVTADGNAATFISDTVISDKVAANGPGLIYPSGYLMLRDGTRYRIDGGNVTWMRDRNGNKMTFTYSGSAVTTITDSLNRQVTITYGDSTQITFKGFGGATRTVLINYTALGNVLRTTNPRNEPASRYQIQSYHGLFPELNNASPYTLYNPAVVSSVVLPNGQQYQFFYNSYAELARVNLPTGGAIEYDYTAGSGLTDEWGDYQVYRRVIERRVYADGSTLEGYTTYVDTTSITFPCPWPEPCQTEATVTVDHRNPGGALVAREKHYFNGDAVSSLFRDGSSYPSRRDGREYRTESYDADGTTLLRRSETTWVNRAPVGWWPYSSVSEPPNDPRVTDITTTFADVSPNLFSKQTFGYDDSVPYNNQNNVKEYDFGSGAPGALLRETRTTYVTATNYTDAVTGAHQRSLPTQTSVYDAGGIERARTTFEYDNYAADANHVALWNRSSISGLDSAFTTSYTTRGNPTATTRYLLVNGSVTGSISAYAQYDIAGNVVKAIDARGNATTIDFSDCFGTPDGNARLNAGSTELNSVGQYSYALPTLVTRAGQTTYTQFDYYLVRPVDAEDANGVTYSGYSDSEPLDRPTKIVRAANQSTSIKSQTTFSYDDTNRIVTTTSDRDTYGDNVLVSKVLYDGLGRTIEARQYEGGSNYIAVQTQFDALGRAYKTSNPFRPWQSESAIWTTSAFDALGRVTTVTTPDNSVVSTSYSGNTVTVTDQNSKARKSVTDALGRLIQVYEDPAGLNYLTGYSYDVLDNLLTVNQGSQTRTFVYDSLKRLTSAINPESGTITYLYDANGNLTGKTDARSITATYVYDPLNRATSRSYSDGTPTVTYTYDTAGVANAKGRLVSVSSSVSSYSYGGYDALGRATGATQTIGSKSYAVGYTYNKAGGVLTETYPSGRTVTYAYDGAGRNSSFTGNLGDGTTRTYSTGIIYASGGQMKQEQFGTTTAVYNKSFYNSRQQLSEIRVSTTPNDTSWNRGAIINYYSMQCWGACNGTDNNGNLKKQEVYVPANDQVSSYTSWYQQYTYDNLNRLTQVNEYTGNSPTNWQQAYALDRYGNRTIDYNNTSSIIPRPQFNVDTNTNRLTVPSGQSGTMGYDSAGNLITDSYTGSGSRTYDAENRMTSAQGSPYWSYYTYDGEGHRVKRNVNNQETWQVYGLGGELLAEYAANAAPTSPQKEYGYRNGALLVTAAPSAQIHWLVSDQLGTPRMIFDQSGSLANVSRHDYLPFGEELVTGQGLRTSAMGYSISDNVRQHFTLKERDIETGLDYFLARYYSSSQGRFTGVDPEQEGARNDDPQSWNGYAYTGGNPVARTDPDGKKYLVCNSEGKSCVEYSDEDFYRIRRENQKDYGFTGNRDFYESGAITQKGETIGTYVQVSIDDPVGQFIFQMRRQTAPIGNATAAFFGISVVAGATGGAVVYALGPAPAVTTLGLATRVGPAAAGAGGVLSQLGQKDAAIFEKAGEYGLSGANSFLNNLQALTRAVVEKIPGGQLNKLGQIGNSPIYGSGRSGVGIAEVDGVTVVVKVVHGNPQVLGPVP